eukprot:169895-Chlamydomonas_euryale.AAC.2
MGFEDSYALGKRTIVKVERQSRGWNVGRHELGMGMDWGPTLLQGRYVGRGGGGRPHRSLKRRAARAEDANGHTAPSSLAWNANVVKAAAASHILHLVQRCCWRDECPSERERGGVRRGVGGTPRRRRAERVQRCSRSRAASVRRSASTRTRMPASAALTLPPAVVPPPPPSRATHARTASAAAVDGCQPVARGMSAVSARSSRGPHARSTRDASAASSVASRPRGSGRSSASTEATSGASSLNPADAGPAAAAASSRLRGSGPSNALPAAARGASSPLLTGKALEECAGGAAAPRDCQADAVVVAVVIRAVVVAAAVGGCSAASADAAAAKCAGDAVLRPAWSHSSTPRSASAAETSAPCARAAAWPPKSTCPPPTPDAATEGRHAPLPSPPLVMTLSALLATAAPAASSRHTAHSAIAADAGRSARPLAARDTHASSGSSGSAGSVGAGPAGAPAPQGARPAGAPARKGACPAAPPALKDASLAGRRALQGACRRFRLSIAANAHSSSQQLCATSASSTPAPTGQVAAAMLGELFAAAAQAEDAVGKD